MKKTMVHTCWTFVEYSIQACDVINLGMFYIKEIRNLISYHGFNIRSKSILMRADSIVSEFAMAKNPSSPKMLSVLIC